MELLAAVETLQWLAEHGPAHPGRRADPLLAHAAPGQARALDLRAARGRRRPRPGARALRHAAGRRRRGAHGRQRRGAQALAARRRCAASGSRASSPAPGLPEGLLQVVHGHTDTGAALVGAPVAQIRFTGSARAGREVGEACARGLKRSVLALDGKDAMLVLGDANVPRAVRGATWAAFANAGQCGGSVERALCVAEVHDRFLAGVIEAAPASCRWATPPIRRRRSARSSPAAAPSACGRWSTTPSPPARRCTAAARAGGRALTRRRCSAA